MTTVDELYAEVRFQYTCSRHRTQFLALLEQEGVRDPAVMEHIRLRFVAETAQHYSGEFIEFLHARLAGRTSCMGCAFEAAGGTCYEWAIETLRRLAQEERAWR